jgi:hypothetical protein
MISPTLQFKQQQNIAQSHFFPYCYSLGKKVGQFKIDAAKLPVNQIEKRLVRSGKNLNRQRECDQPGLFLIIRLEVTAI